MPSLRRLVLPMDPTAEDDRASLSVLQASSITLAKESQSPVATKRHFSTSDDISVAVSHRVAL